MASTSAPFGFRPVFHAGGGTIRPVRIGSDDFSGILGTYNTKIYRGSPVVLTTSGQVNIAGTTGAIAGIFAGCEYTDASGSRLFRDYWPGSVGATNAIAYIYNDPNIVYEVQADGSVASSAIGDEANVSNVGNGSTASGVSGATLSSTLAGATATAQFQIVDRGLGVDNSWSDAYPIIRVKINQLQFGPASVAAF